MLVFPTHEKVSWRMQALASLTSKNSMGHILSLASSQYRNENVGNMLTQTVLAIYQHRGEALSNAGTKPFLQLSPGSDELGKVLWMSALITGIIL